MLDTDSKSPYIKVDIGEIKAFYTRHNAGSEGLFDDIHAITQDERELEIAHLDCAGTIDVEEMALILGDLCHKRVWRQRAQDSIFELIPRQPKRR